MASNIPVIVQGNSFNLAIPLQIYVINGDQMELQDYTPDPTDQISIQLKGSRRNYTYTPTSVSDNVCMIVLGGYELADNYSVCVTIVKANGQRLRSFRTDQFFIVESSDDLTQDDIIQGLEENVIYLNSSIFVAGEEGRGIVSIVKTSTSGLVDTYTITYSDATTSTFNVTNGAQGEPGATISSVEKTATAGKVDTYTITMTDGSTFTFQVTNGMDGVDLGLANIVNDLTTGGATNVLSAEMGKVLNNTKPTIGEGSEDADLEVVDEDGYILARFEDGNFEVKNFSSAAVSVLLNKYKGKKISILGDSISTFGDPTSTNQNGTYCWSYYPTATCRYSVDGVDSISFDVNDTYWMRLMNRLGSTLGINESYRGTLVTGSGSTAFNNQTRIDHLGNNGTPDLILVFGGTNDAGNSATIGTFNGGVYSDYDTAAKIAALDVSTFANAYKAMLIRLMYTYPTSEIVCILPTFTTSYYTIQALDDYVEIIKEACDFFGIKWIDVRVSDINIFNKATYLVDGIHPNAQGMQLLANKIYKHLIFD